MINRIKQSTEDQVTITDVFLPFNDELWILTAFSERANITDEVSRIFNHGMVIISTVSTDI